MEVVYRLWGISMGQYLCCKGGSDKLGSLREVPKKQREMWSKYSEFRPSACRNGSCEMGGFDAGNVNSAKCEIMCGGEKPDFPLAGLHSPRP